jgi:hypothetical protein
MNRELDLRIADDVLHLIHYRENDKTRAIIKKGTSSTYAMCEFKKMPARMRLEATTCECCGRDCPPSWTSGNADRYFTTNLPFYSSVLADAFAVVEEMAKNGCKLRLTLSGSWRAEWCAEFLRDGYPKSEEYSSSAPEAICLAALAALENSP